MKVSTNIKVTSTWQQIDLNQTPIKYIDLHMLQLKIEAFYISHALQMLSKSSTAYKTCLNMIWAAIAHFFMWSIRHFQGVLSQFDLDWLAVKSASNFDLSGYFHKERSWLNKLDKGVETMTLVIVTVWLLIVLNYSH